MKISDSKKLKKNNAVNSEVKIYAYIIYVFPKRNFL